MKRRQCGWVIKKGNKCDNLIAAAGVFELTVVETGAAAEEVVDLAGFDVVGKTGDEEGADTPPVLATNASVILERGWRELLVVLEVVRIVFVRLKSHGRVGGDATTLLCVSLLRTSYCVNNPTHNPMGC